jgi:hypothetical protein
MSILNSSNQTFRLLTVILVIIASGLPAVNKLTGDIPPEWFVAKFSPSIIGKIPMGVILSYIVIVGLEVVTPLLFIVGVFRKEWKMNMPSDYTNKGFLLLLTLFVILTFGSFLVEDYSNAFKDFMYFTAAAILQSLWNLSKSDKYQY